MPIQATRLIVTGGGRTVEPVKKEEPKEIVVKTTTVVDNIKEPSVVVDGKVRKISKKSAFLLDMLTLDD